MQNSYSHFFSPFKQASVAIPSPSRLLKTFFWFAAVTASAECVNKVSIVDGSSESVLLKLHCCAGDDASFDATYYGTIEGVFQGSEELLPELCQLAQQDGESLVTHGASWVRIWDSPEVSVETIQAVKQIRDNVKQYFKSTGIMEITFFCTELDKLAKHIENGEAAAIKSDFTYAGIQYISGKTPAEYANDLRSAAQAKRDETNAYLASPEFKAQFSKGLASKIQDSMNEQLKGKVIKFPSEEERPAQPGMRNRQ